MDKATSGKKMIVAHNKLSFVYRSKNPIITGRIKYKIEEVAVAPPPTTDPSSNVTVLTKEEVVISVKATMIITRVKKMNILKRIQTLFETYCLMVSAIPAALCRIEATKAPISWTPPIKILPKRIHNIVGIHP